MSSLALTLGADRVEVEVDTAIVAGFTGRDQDAVRRHIDELQDLGVRPPSSTPIFYRVSASRLTTDPEIESTPASSGESEALLLHYAGQLWVGVGSDHTDRELEAHSVAASKQLCDKPIAAQFWRYDEVSDHWDELILRSFVGEHEDEGEALYQEGPLAGLIAAADLLRLASPAPRDGTIMFCGTVPVHGQIRPSTVFRYELEDPVMERRIGGRYAVKTLPMVV